MKHAAMNKVAGTARHIPVQSLRRDEFAQNILPWLIGLPVSLIIIHVFSF